MKTKTKLFSALSILICLSIILVGCKSGNMDDYIEKLEASEWSFVAYDQSNMEDHPYYDNMDTSNIVRIIEAVKVDSLNITRYGTIVEFDSYEKATESYSNFIKQTSGYMAERIGKVLIYANDADFFNVIGVDL